MRLQRGEKTFSEEVGEARMEFVDEYIQISRDYSLTPVQKFQHLHNLLRGGAKSFYLDKVDCYATGFHQAVSMIEEEYISVVRQTRVKNCISNLRLTSFTSDGTEESAALAKVYKITIQFSRQCQSLRQRDAHKVEFLQNAVVGFLWSYKLLRRVATHRLTFQQLYGEFEVLSNLIRKQRLLNFEIVQKRAGSGPAKRNLAASSVPDKDGMLAIESHCEPLQFQEKVPLIPSVHKGASTAVGITFLRITSYLPTTLKQLLTASGTTRRRLT